uniref:Glycosyl transferase family 25 domain-containing protein n=1 Tax=viral metagenome TaxID=1070528 RepID=A0A6C0KE39_9ZZZZ
MSSLLDIINDFTGTSNNSMYMIHLKRAVERLPYIHRLEQKLNMKIPIFDACEGSSLIANGHPTKCAHTLNYYRSAGEVGCTVSHINICKEALKQNYDHIVIFEDDCELNKSLEELKVKLDKFKSLNISWDLFCIGGDIIGTRMNDTFMRVDHFYCTHAVILNRKFMQELISLYETFYRNGTTWAVDGLYSDVLRSKKTNGYGFIPNKTNDFFRQATGLKSYIER